MARGKSQAEVTTTGVCMRMGLVAKTALNTATTARRAEEAEEAAATARAEAVRAMAAAIPLLTAEQRETLRPILSGSLDQAGADSTAA
jgi:protein-disulfide isomerase-like protein with CxxC motif